MCLDFFLKNEAQIHCTGVRQSVGSSDCATGLGNNDPVALNMDAILLHLAVLSSSLSGQVTSLSGCSLTVFFLVFRST